MNDPDVLRADRSHLDSVTDVLSEAMSTLDVASWLVADPTHRLRVLAPVTRIYVEHALEYGQIDLTRDGNSVVLYYLDNDVPPPERFEERVRAAAGPYADRFLTFSATLDAHHPHDVTPHAYIAMLGRRAGASSMGIAYIMRERLLRQLDRAGVPAYFEASTERLRQGFRRRGARDVGAPIRMPDNGPELFPMWREPRPLD